jgi:hypothetical protein
MTYQAVRSGALIAVLPLCAGCLLAMTGCDGGGTDDSSDGETYTLFECPTSPSSIDDFAPYRDPASVEEIRATIYAEVSSRIETDQLAPCADAGESDDCVEGHYTSSDGAQVDYTLSHVTTTSNPSPDYTTTETISEEAAHIGLPDGAATWSALDWSATGSDLDVSYYGDGTGSHDEIAFQAAWTGSLAPALPDDFALAGTVGQFFGDNVADMGDYAALSHERCEFSVRVSEEPTVYIRIYDHELRSNDQDAGGKCTIDGECVGVIDIDSWEIVGDCG